MASNFFFTRFWKSRFWSSNVKVATCKSSVEGAGRRTEFARGAAERSVHSLYTLLPKVKSKKYANGLFRVFQQVFGIADLAYSKGSGRNLEHRPEDTFGINYERPGYGFLWFCDVRSGKCCFKKNRSGNKSENSFISFKKCCHNFSDLFKCIYWQCHHLPLLLRE